MVSHLCQVHTSRIARKLPLCADSITCRESSLFGDLDKYTHEIVAILNKCLRFSVKSFRFRFLLDFHLFADTWNCSHVKDGSKARGVSPALPRRPCSIEVVKKT